MKALILVDIQNDFLPGGALGADGGDAIVPVANQLQRVFNLVVATRDWHPHNHKSFAPNNPGKNVGETIELNGLEQIMWPVHCVQHTPGAEFSEALDTSKIDKVFFKGVDPEIDSYSAFYDNAHRRATGLSDYLKERNVDQVYICGLVTDVCVKFSALDAVKDGFETYVIEDGCRGVELNQGDTAKAIQEMKDAGVKVIHSKLLV